MFLHPQTVINHFDIQDGMQVTDLGAGRGDFTFLLSDRVGDYGRVYAVDIAPEALSLIQEKAKEEGLSNIHFIRGDVEQELGTTIASNILDRVVITNTLFQTVDKKAVLREALRILKPQGKLIVVDWKDSFGNIGPHPDHVLTFDEIKYLGDSVGFDFHKEFVAGEYHYGIIFLCKQPNLSN